MDFVVLLFFSCIMTAIELFLIYYSYPKKVEINSTNNSAPLKIYTNYFFLPFTTKITEYNNISNMKLYVDKDIANADRVKIYSLILHLPGQNILLKKGNKLELSKECKAILESINSSQEYVLLNNSSLQMGIVVCFFVFILFLICINGKSGIDIMTDERTMEFYTAYMISTLVFFAFVLSSVILNSLDKYKKKKTNTHNKQYGINEESIKEWDRLAADAQKIYDSLIK